MHTVICTLYHGHMLLMLGWLLNNVALVWSANHSVHGTSCLCTLSTSALELGGIPVFSCITILTNASIGYRVY